jgi:ribose transport system permease protein/putative xylitol transport system permease protein
MIASITGSVSEWFEEQRESRTVQDWVIDIGPFVTLIVLALFFTSQTDRFLTYGNIVNNVAKNSSVLLLVALAGTFPIMQQSIDLSVASLVTLSGVAVAVLIADFGVSGPVALLIGILLAVFAGWVNGAVFTKGKIPSFLVTLGTLSILEGGAGLLTGGASVPFRNQAIKNLSNGTLILDVPNIVIITLVVYAITIFVAFRTKFGRYTYALGENESVVDLSGVKVDRYKIGAFVISGLLCGIAGALLTARIGTAAATMGQGLLLPSIAAIVMGGTALTGGVGGPHRTILGVLVIAILRNGMNLISVNPFVQTMILGGVVIIAVALSIDRRKIDIVK